MTYNFLLHYPINNIELSEGRRLAIYRDGLLPVLLHTFSMTSNALFKILHLGYLSL